MATANQDYFDAALRHQIGVRRFAAGEVAAILAILEESDREIVLKLRKALVKTGGGLRLTDRRLALMLQSIRKLRKATFKAVREKLRDDLGDLGVSEAAFETRMLDAAIPIDVDFASVSVGQLRAIATSRPFQGRFLREWFQDLERADQERLKSALRLGQAQGESVPNIVRRVAGTRARRFTDGALSITRRNAETVVRTAINHVSNRAREDVWEANADIVQAVRWTSTLDGRTSAICRSRDGKYAPVGNNPLPEQFKDDRLVPARARPPAHPNCRSVMVAALDPQGVVGDRPFVRDTRRRGEREVDFRKRARENGTTVAQERRKWADENIGQVPAKTSYNDWLKTQPASFQDEVLGTTKARLFRKGGLTLDKFVDRKGTELTLDQLRATEPEAFILAGLDT